MTQTRMLRFQSNYLQRDGLPILGYLTMTAITTWPLLPRFLTHIPGGGDGAWFLWQLWWFKHALVDLRQSPFVTDLIYYPLTDVPITIQTPINEYFTLPLQVAIGVTPLYNLLFLCAYILSGYTTYLLGLTLVRRRDLAFIGGVIFAFCSYRGMRGLGHLSLFTTEWMPLAILCAIQCWRRPSWQRGASAGITAALVALSSPYYVGMFLFPVGLAGIVYLLLGQGHQRFDRTRWRAALSAIIVFTLGTGPFYLSLFSAPPEIYAVNQKLAESTWRFSADLFAWVVPSGLHPLWGQFTASIYRNFTSPNLMETTVYLGLIPFTLACATLLIGNAVRTLRFWQLVGVIAAILALGPELHLNGNTIMAGLPYQWLLQLPGFDAFRIPSRAGVTTALAVSILALFALEWLRQRLSVLQWRIIWPLLTLLIWIDITPLFPYPTSSIAIPSAYSAIAETPDHSALLELPAGEFLHSRLNFLDDVSWYMYYQSYHQKPIISGYLGRRPQRLINVERNLPFVRSFFQDVADRHLFNPALIAMMPDPLWPDEIARGEEHLAQQGIAHVFLRCTPAWPSYCYEAQTLLQQSFDPPQVVDELQHYQVQAPAYTTAYVPADLITPPLRFDAAFGDGQVDERGRWRTLQKPTGTITVAIPFQGIWKLAGEIEGINSEELSITLDGIALSTQATETSRTNIDADLELAPGIHTIQVALAPGDGDLTGQSCAAFCLRNLHVTLRNPFSPPPTPVATFVNEAGEQVNLLATTLFDSPVRATHLPVDAQLLVNIWQLDEGSFQTLQDDPTQMPVNYIHLTDRAGNTLQQADHPLGQRRILLSDAKIIFDIVALPDTNAIAEPVELRMGLWYPQRELYFWSPDARDIDPSGRIRLGELADFETLAAPSRSTPAESAIPFSNSVDGRLLRLLDASIVKDALDPEQYQLATIWEQPDLFLTPVSISLFVHLTDQAGNTLLTAEHVLPSYQLTWHKSGLIYDRLALPATIPGTVYDVRIGLWYPDKAQYYETEPSNRVDALGRLLIGTVDE